MGFGDFTMIPMWGSIRLAQLQKQAGSGTIDSSQYSEA